MPAEFPARDNISEQNEKLERLREEVEQTRALFQGAKEAYDRALERSKDLGAAHPDGSVGHSTHVYRHTLYNYRTALWRFNRFILDGKLLDEEKPRKSSNMQLAHYLRKRAGAGIFRPRVSRLRQETQRSKSLHFRMTGFHRKQRL